MQSVGSPLYVVSSHQTHRIFLRQIRIIKSKYIDQYGYSVLNMISYLIDQILFLFFILYHIQFHPSQSLMFDILMCKHNININKYITLNIHQTSCFIRYCLLLLSSTSFMQQVHPHTLIINNYYMSFYFYPVSGSCDHFQLNCSLGDDNCLLLSFNVGLLFLCS